MWRAIGRRPNGGCGRRPARGATLLLLPHHPWICRGAHPTPSSSGLTRGPTPAARLWSWIPGSRPGMTEVGEGHRQEAQRRLRTATCKRRNAAVIASPSLDLSRSSPHPPSSSGLTRGPTPAPRQRLWIPGSGPGMTEVVEGHRQEAQGCCCLTIAGFATEFTTLPSSSGLTRGPMLAPRRWPWIPGSRHVVTEVRELRFRRTRGQRRAWRKRAHPSWRALSPL
ncbi:hypothetical protein GGI59_005846 [Rhizobium lentis]|uniref:Uncharacterized protein n=1 Tax=Rhizobium lentis TaxID=1138194 RepID=A0A7W8XJW7_9HYPH|nr:hypothetical protein [Rhizobium lentis]MBB5553503.1 hypothetical protein [Rhizobium lentis]MBB5564139.1 hypothetical protein [Rhizobium lentis]MBB5570551.1 hypothetical protein [Rhizobium lentis]